MSKSTHFSEQPLYCQIIKLLAKAKVLNKSRENGGERYVKSFDGWAHLVVMLYAVIVRFDSLREITSLFTNRGSQTVSPGPLGDDISQHFGRCQQETSRIRI